MEKLIKRQVSQNFQWEKFLIKNHFQLSPNMSVAMLNAQIYQDSWQDY